MFKQLVHFQPNQQSWCILPEEVVDDDSCLCSNLSAENGNSSCYNKLASLEARLVRNSALWSSDWPVSSLELQAQLILFSYFLSELNHSIKEPPPTPGSNFLNELNNSYEIVFFLQIFDKYYKRKSHLTSLQASKLR